VLMLPASTAYVGWLSIFAPLRCARLAGRAARPRIRISGTMKDGRRSARAIHRHGLRDFARAISERAVAILRSWFGAARRPFVVRLTDLTLSCAAGPPCRSEAARRLPARSCMQTLPN
jgi:hypothetical protein